MIQKVVLIYLIIQHHHNSLEKNQSFINHIVYFVYFCEEKITTNTKRFLNSHWTDVSSIINIIHKQAKKKKRKKLYWNSNVISKLLFLSGQGRKFLHFVSQTLTNTIPLSELAIFTIRMLIVAIFFLCQTCWQKK